MQSIIVPLQFKTENSILFSTHETILKLTFCYFYVVAMFLRQDALKTHLKKHNGEFPGKS